MFRRPLYFGAPAVPSSYLPWSDSTPKQLGVSSVLYFPFPCFLIVTIQYFPVLFHNFCNCSIILRHDLWNLYSRAPVLTLLLHLYAHGPFEDLISIFFPRPVWLCLCRVQVHASRSQTWCFSVFHTQVLVSVFISFHFSTTWYLLWCPAWLAIRILATVGMQDLLSTLFSVLFLTSSIVFLLGYSEHGFRQPLVNCCK